MMAKSPKVIAIGDSLSDLTALAEVLNRHGVPCHRIHYTGGPDEITPCPAVRLVIADFPLGGGVVGIDPTVDFSVLRDLLENAIRPTGPYAILLWTMYPEFASELQALLQHLRGVPKPVEVTALAKADHLDDEGRIRDEAELNRQIDTLAHGWARPKGALALVGAWGELEDEEVDAMVEEIYVARRQGVDQSMARASQTSLGFDESEFT